MRSAASSCAVQGDLDLVDWLLEEGADALATGDDGCMPGDCASNASVRKTLYKTGVIPSGSRSPLRPDLTVPAHAYAYGDAAIHAHALDRLSLNDLTGLTLNDLTG